MIRKTLIAAAAAATLALGLGGATAPAQAAKFGIYVEVPGFHGYRGHRHWHCHVRKVWRHGHWRWVKRCHGHRHGGGHH